MTDTLSPEVQDELLESFRRMVDAVFAEEPSRPGRALAFTNQAGGAGKSTSAANVGASAAALGYRVLIVGTDAQCDVSVILGYEPDQLPDQPNLHDVLIGTAQVHEAILPALAGRFGAVGTKVIDNLFILLESDALENAEQILTPLMQRELWLRKAIDPIRGYFDLILFDCPGNLGLMVVNAIVASNEVVACAKPGWKELRALTRIEETIEDIEAAFKANGAQARLAYVLIVDVPTTRSQGVVYSESEESARKAYGELVLPPVRRSTKIPEAYAAQKVLLHFDRASQATSDYFAVTKAMGLPRRSS